MRRWKEMFAEKKNEITVYIVAILVFICAVAVSLSIFLICVQKSIEHNSKKLIETNISRQNEHISAILDIHYGYLNGIAGEMGKSETLVSEENMELLASLKEKTVLERIAVIETDGTAHYDNGEVKNVAGRRYFKEAMKGQETLSDPLESIVDKKVRVILGVPIYKDKEVIGVLGGSYDVTSLSPMLFDDFFGGTGCTMLTTGKGEIIAYEGNTSGVEITYGDDFFEAFGNYMLTGNSSVDAVKEAFASGIGGTEKMRSKTAGYQECYLTYRKMELNDWMICYVIPISEAQKSYDFIREYEVSFTAGFILMVGILFLFVIGRNRDRNKQLLRAAQIDSLTCSYNKRSTEEHINGILRENPQEAGIFLIMDIDYFKAVNDRFGHITGDKVLHRFGEVLHEHFREGDIIGRIGGDEFVVFMRSTDNREAAVSRIEELIRKIEKLSFAEMNGENITISVGAAFSPEHGTGYLDLYKNADTALYRRKQNGRNGYTVYEEKWERSIQ